MRRSSVSPTSQSQLDSTAAARRRKLLFTGAQLCALALAVAACKPGGPSGQVVATVNGKEITSQDLASEARATGATGNVNAPALLQQVVARMLLAQSAHDQKLDAYPGYPSDVVRIQQSFLAEKALQRIVKPGGAPAPAAIAAFEAAHPYVFSQRVRMQATELKFQTSDDLKSLQGVNDLPSVLSRLKALGVPVEQKSSVLDTAQMPDQLAARLVSAPLNQLQFFREGNVTLGIVISAREAVVGSPDQETAFATQLMAKMGVQNQVNAAVNQLKAKAKIVYQKGYAPPAPTPPAPAKG